MKPRITIIATGSEITAGRSIDTNSGWIANELFSLGWKVRNFIALPDNPKFILEELTALKETAKKEPVLAIMTGGLGPTEDDYTLETVLDLQSKDSYIVERARLKLESIYKSRGKSYENILETVLRQTKVPNDSFVLDNTVGIAPGFVEEIGASSYLVCMPGVPSEMKEMFAKKLIPFLKRTYSQGKLFQETKWIWNMGESLFQSEFISKLEDLFSEGLEWGVTAQRGFIKAIFQSENETLVKTAIQRLQEFYGSKCTGDVFIETHEFLKDKKQKLAVAESCTAGQLGKRITDLPGSSAYFLGGILTYSNEAKVSELGVEPSVLESKGAVSEQVALAMVNGLESKWKSDYSLSITGIAGPEGGSAEKPVGTVWIGFKSKGKEARALSFRFPGNRDSIREISANTALYLLHSGLLFERFE